MDPQPFELITHIIDFAVEVPKTQSAKSPKSQTVNYSDPFGSDGDAYHGRILSRLSAVSKIWHNASNKAKNSLKLDLAGVDTFSERLRNLPLGLRELRICPSQLSAGLFWPQNNNLKKQESSLASPP
jgi:hypothetical protein